jgi:cytochrome c-type biogenesis protein CcmE
LTLKNLKFFIGSLVIIAAVIYLIITSTQANAQYFLTVDELLAQNESITEKQVRVSGAVLGDTIQYDPEKLTLSFTVVHIPADNQEIETAGGLAKVLHEAVNNQNLSRLNIIYNGPKPDLLQNEAQAIITGHLGKDGIFYADELLLKCPTRYEESLPGQVES